MIWAVLIRRVSTATVYVDDADPVEARRLALELVTESDFDTTTTCAAYEQLTEPAERWWTGGAWVYPPTEMFGGDR